MKYCKDCKHYKEFEQYARRSEYKCKLTYIKEYKENPVNGMDKYITARDCSACRLDENNCGKDARYFKHRNIFIRLYQSLMQWSNK